MQWLRLQRCLAATEQHALRLGRVSSVHQKHVPLPCLPQLEARELRLQLEQMAAQLLTKQQRLEAAQAAADMAVEQVRHGNDMAP